MYRYAYLRAAETLRAPYWDWGFDSNVPNATTVDTMVVNMPFGEQLVPTTIPNPLSTYHFPKAALDGRWGAFDIENRSQIYRCDEWPKSYPSSADSLMADRPYKSWVVRFGVPSRPGSELIPLSMMSSPFRETSLNSPQLAMKG